MWTVSIKRKKERALDQLPVKVQNLFADLKSDLEFRGPIQNGWQNFSKLSENSYHCHLTRDYVACWKVTSTKNCELEVYYVGSREGSPY